MMIKETIAKTTLTIEIFYVNSTIKCMPSPTDVYVDVCVVISIYFLSEPLKGI